MTLFLSVAAIIAVLGFILWYGNSQKTAGADGVKAQTNKEALDAIVEAARPATVIELDDVRKRFKRD